jgi:tRNA G26 N,N-dimethylase Trm1
MAHPNRKRCTCCGKHTSIVGPLSWNAGNCRRCGQELMVENIIGISTKTGPAYRRWLRGYASMIEREVIATRAGSA